MAREPRHPLDRSFKKGAAAKKQGPRRPPSGGSKRPRRPRAAAGGDSGPPEGTVRIQKYLAGAGIDSRRACEELVAEGRVRVNGRVVDKLPIFVRPDADRVEVDGVTVRPPKAAAGPVYILVNKPKGVVSTNKDPSGRPRVIDLAGDVPTRVFPVGRLDADSTGIILLTNDGDLANRISHPRYGLVKTYVVEVDGEVSGEAIERIKKGLYLDGKRTSGAAVKVLRRQAARTLLEVRLKEGRNREIRRMLARLNYKVRALRRTAIGPITDRGIKTGNSRPLTGKEVAALKRATRGE
ncbi:MAG: rRNA pseudouridine synthase [Planctomycetes bacterium]|nr:rRNA pseudouridine synthase [Planctomycetota bacterium]